MAPKGNSSKKQMDDTNGSATSSAPKQLTNVPWPRLRPKDLTLPSSPPEWLIPDQVCLLPGFLTADECQALIALFDDGSSGSSSSTANARGAASKSKNGGKPNIKDQVETQHAQRFTLSPSPPAKKGEAVRTNYRASTVDPEFAHTLFRLGLDKAVQDWPSLDKPRAGVKPKTPAGLHANIRIYRYDPGAIFGPHYDQSSICPVTRLSSEWTLLVYLSGGPGSDLTGGQTIFYDNHSEKSSRKWEVEPRAGLALLHRHGSACMLHAALPPLAGTKWVLRSDLLFQ
ncbi:hypothetical protein OC846_003094 [Tilletia horrida]|uniref:Fe2OG dioxygenase domain-containing protein n=1 Tax=Tilletia horrida TaxID=155126 RepID=A0AAN6GPM5_9BASI|nr:hypothetical protein OC845_002010 [Tilletia horrida]KAK0551913.1 hypothetical protein OC846_003094 [Tilletia horrida]KAK0568667.1 hypothetical protein OC861_001744 [Tilletia horrida]